MPSPTAAAATHRHDFKGLSDWIEVFQAGTHTDSKGRTCSFTTADLDQMAANVSLGRPPAVLGHPKHNDPAYGWADLKRDGGSLFAKFSDVNPAFEAGVNSGAYRNRSVSVVSDKAHGWRVRHIGWLGAAPPAIDGLRPVEFAGDDSTEVHEFSASALWSQSWAMDGIASGFRRLREWLIGREGQDVADRVMPDYEIRSIADTAATLRVEAGREALEDAAEGEAAAPPASTLFNAPQAGAHDMPFSQSDLDRAVAETEARVRAEAAAAQSAEFTAAQARLATLESERRQERIGGQVNALLTGGLVTPAEIAGLAEFLGAVDDSAEFAFTAAGAELTSTPAKWLLDFIAKRGPVVKLGERVVKAETEGAEVDANNYADIARAATAYQFEQSKVGNTVAADAAVCHVMRVAGKG